MQLMCYLCDGMADKKDMKKWRGQWYHNVKIPRFTDTCFQAVKNNDRQKKR